MTMLVTGGGGFLGRHLVEQLRRRGETVRVLGRRDYPDLRAQGVETVRGDLADAAAVRKACAGVDAVFHVAAKAGIWGARADYCRANVIGTRNVLAGCRAHAVPRLVYTSTPSVVYGREPIENGNESLPYPPRHLTHYAATKAEAERMVLRANGEDLMTCSLRPHLIWGPGDTNLVPRIVARARRGRLRRIGSGENRIGVSYVENVAEGHLCACDRLVAGSPVRGRAYFINEAEPVDCWAFIDRILDACGAPRVKKSVSLSTACRLGALLEIVYTLLHVTSEPPMTRFLALQLATSHWFDISRARRELGWTPRVDVEEGLKRLGTWWRAAGE